MDRSPRYKGAVSIGACLILLVVGLVFYVLSGGSGPIVHVDHTEVDIGTITFGAPVSYTFTLENTGDAPLALTQIETTCACTASALTRLIEPAEVGQVVLSAETLGFRTGVPERIAATIATNDVNKGALELSVRFVLEPEFEVSIPMFSFGDSPDGARLISQIRTTQRSSGSVVGVRSTTSAVSARLVRRADFSGDELFDVEAILLDSGRVAEGGVVIVETSSSYLPEIRLPVTGR